MLMIRTLAICLLFAGSVPAEQDRNDVRFGDGVLPILKESCFKCHDAASKKGGFDLSSYETTMKGVVPGAPEKSKLYTSVTGASPKMPKGAGPLTKAQTDAIAAWIRSGARNSPPPRPALSSSEEAMKAGKDGTKPVVLFFGDAGAKSKLFLEMLGDPSLDDSFGGVAYAAVAFDKTSDESRKLKVTAAPTLLVLDPRGEAPKELKKLAGGSPAAVKAAIAAAVKTMSK
jgi:hypothetical protein